MRGLIYMRCCLSLVRQRRKQVRKNAKITVFAGLAAVAAGAGADACGPSEKNKHKTQAKRQSRDVVRYQLCTLRAAT